MKQKNYSKSIAGIIDSFLTENGWHFSFDDRFGIFRFDLHLMGRIKKVSYIIDVKEDEYVVYAISPLGADENDENMMAAMAEFVCRANYGLVNGNFELDMKDGEIRYKCYVDCEGITPARDIIRNSIHCPAAMYDRYGAGIVEIIFGNSTAKDAVDKCEKFPAEELRALLDEEPDEDGDMDAMLARLATRLGIDESDYGAGGEEDEPDDGESEVKTDLFDTEAGGE